MIIRDHLPWDRVWPRMWRRLVLLFVFDLTVSVLYTYGLTKYVSFPALPVLPMGSVLTIFLAFRTNSAYARWWEARSLWGQLVNSSRSLARQVITFIQGSTPAQANLITHDKRSMVHLQIAFVCALRCHLRKQNPFPELRSLVDDKTFENLREQRNVPAALLLELGLRLREAFSQGRIDSYRWVAADQTLTELCNVMGGCERIKNTPLPRQYEYFPRILVHIFCLLLPLGLVDGLQLLTPLVSTLVSFMFVALEQVGREIENPFENTVHDTPMTALSRTIEINLRQSLGETRVPQELQHVNGFVY
jgi:ion channel-forming bestrophin family protein